MSTLLEVSGVSVSFDGFKAINNLSFQIAERELRGREQFSSDGVLAFLASSQKCGSTARFHSGNYRNSVPLREQPPQRGPRQFSVERFYSVLLEWNSCDCDSCVISYATHLTPMSYLRETLFFSIAPSLSVNRTKVYAG